jgi:hypothetical protein
MRGYIAVTLLALASAGGCGARPPSAPTPSSPTSSSTNQPSPAPEPSPQAGPMAGTYAMDLTMDQLSPECQRVPDAVRHLAYTAAITGDGNYTVTLSGGEFLTGSICTFNPTHLGCNQFSATESANELRFDLANNNDDGHGGHIVAQVPQAGWFELIGSTTGAMNNGTIVSNGNGTLWYCAASLSYPFPCPSFVGCAVGDLRMTFVRQ